MNDIKKAAPKKSARTIGETSAKIGDAKQLKIAKDTPKSLEKKDMLAAEPKKAAPKKFTLATSDAPNKAGDVKPPKAAKDAPKRTKKFTVIPSERHAMIAEAAYYRAEQRGFTGDPHMDWLEAEAEIDKML
ncbi:MAG: DUF2934 domain-containing protein [Gammaproteobacteria bacterium]